MLSWRKNIVYIYFFFGSFGAFAATCPNKTFLENASDTFKPLFSDPPDLSSNSKIPFKGKVQNANCSDKFSSCRVVFEVQEIFFDPDTIFIEVFFELTGIKKPSTTTIAVTIDQVTNEKFLEGSEWFVIPENYSSRDGEGSGFVFNASCGVSIAQYESEMLVIDKGKLTIPYQKVRAEILRPITPEGTVRLKRTISELIKSEIGTRK